MRNCSPTIPRSICASTLPWAATASCWPIWCGDCWRTAPTRPSSPRSRTRNGRSLRCCAARRPSSTIPRMRGIPASCGRAICFGRAKIRAALNSATAARSRRCWLRLPRQTLLSPKSLKPPSSRHRRRSPPRSAVSPAGAARPPSGALPVSNAPPICWTAAAASSSRCCSRKAARRSTTRWPNCARRSISAATTRNKGRAQFGADIAAAGTDRREQSFAAARPRRVRRDLAVEFSAGDFCRPGHRGADGRATPSSPSRRSRRR